MTKYYVDSCIWLNLFNKETRVIQGLPVWKIAALFLEQKQGRLFSSTFVLEEVGYKTNEKNADVIEALTECIVATSEDMAFGRDIESKESYILSFFDCMHIALAKRKGLTLITRDKELLWRGQKYVEVMKPESLLY